MADDILLKVRLDTAGARRDLAALYGDMARAPRTSTSSGPVGGGGGSGGGGGGSGGGGGGSSGISLGAILAKLTALLAAQQMVGAAGGAFVAGGKDMLREQLLSGHLGQARGAVAARDVTAGRLGLAYDLGLVSDNQLKQAFQVEKDFGAGAQARGTAKARAALQGATMMSIGSDAGELLAEVIPVVGELTTVGRGLIDALREGGVIK